MAAGGAAAPELASGSDAKVESLGDGKFRLGLIEFESKARSIRVPCKVDIKQDVLEYVLVHEQGKVHESLLTTAASPLHLQIVLKLLNYGQGKGDLLNSFLPPGTPHPVEKVGEAVEILVESEGRPPRLVNQCILDRTTNAPLEPVPWVCTGSEVIDGKFQAEVEGSIIALYRDALAMFNSPHPRMTDDENWFPVGAELPEAGQPVTLILRPALPAAAASSANSPKS